MAEKKKICILGSGAMGGLYGSSLTFHPSLDVYFLVRSPQKAAFLEKHGIELAEADRIWHIPVQCLASGSDCSWMDYALVLVKSHQTEQAYYENPTLFTERTRVLTLQNGLGGTLFLEKHLTPEQFCAGISNHNSTVLAPGRILHGGTGRTLIGSFSPEGRSCAEAFVELFSGSRTPCEYTGEIRLEIWKKLMVNLSINPLTAIHQICNGQIAQQVSLQEKVRCLVKEALLVAQAEGVVLEEEKVMAHILHVAQATARGRSSMLQDRLKHRKTEIDAINGAVVALAEKYNIDVPYNRAIVEQIHDLEAFD